MRIQSKRLTWGGALLAALAVVIAIAASGDTAHAAAFNPEASASVDDPTPGANSDVTTTLNIPAPSPQFAAVVTFIPGDWGIALDADVPDGALVAKLASLATLGLLNGPCNNSLSVAFDMMDATVNMSDQTTFDDQFDIVGSLPLGVTKYPDYLTRILVDKDPDDPAAIALQPIARLYGQTVVSGVDVSLNFVIFDKTGITIRDTVLDAALGYPSVVVLQAVGDPQPDPEPGAITDFCTPLTSTTITFGITKNGPAGTGGGVTYRTNPGDGTYNYMTFAAGQRDADGDDIENGLDTCPFDPDPNWDPRSASNPGIDDDPDAFNVPTGDGIPISCDPLPNDQGNPGVGAVNDHDGDGYQNRQDNCPLVANSKGIAYAGASGPDNQDDDDSDGIGNACDPNPNVADGAQTVLCMVHAVTIGSGGTAPPAPDVCTADAISVPGVGGAADADGDGVPDASDNCPNTANASQTDSDSDGVGDACDDSDGDGVMDAVDRCANTPAGASVDEFGCTSTQAQEDDDGDGVKNIDDECPNTPAAEVSDVDEKGCSPSQLASQNTTTTTGGAGGPDTGVGSLAPVASSVPAWAAIVSALGGAGLLGSLGAFASRIIRRRRE